MVDPVLLGVVIALTALLIMLVIRRRGSQADPDAGAEITVTDIYLYPIKSMRGIRVNEWPIGTTGFMYDRRWMVVHAERHEFITQRQAPRMALLQPRLENNNQELWLSTVAPAERRRDVMLGFTDEKRDVQERMGGVANTYKVRVWGDSVDGIDCGDEVAQWLTEFLGEPVRLVRMPDDCKRSVTDKRTSHIGTIEDVSASFADKYPFLLISQASLRELNTHMPAGVELEMRRFRPNIVVAGCSSYAEDRWKLFQIGNVTLYGVKPCGRCRITTVDPDLGEFGEQPLKWLKENRSIGEGNYIFGQNCVHEKSGVVMRVGERVHIKEL